MRGSGANDLGKARGFGGSPGKAWEVDEAWRSEKDRVLRSCSVLCIEADAHVDIPCSEKLNIAGEI